MRLRTLAGGAHRTFGSVGIDPCCESRVEPTNTGGSDPPWPQTPTRSRELDRDEAWKLLKGQTVGRLAVSVAGQPDVFPVNFPRERHVHRLSHRSR